MKKVLGVIGVVALLAGNGFAQNDGRKAEAKTAEKAEFKKEKQRGMLEDIPDLTEKQKAEIKTIKAENRKKMEPQQKEVRELRNKLSEMKRAEKPDENQINMLIDKTARLEAAIAKSKTAAELQVRGVLTAEQRKVVDAKQKEHMEMREKRHTERNEMRNAK